MPKIKPFLWFDGKAAEAMNFYVSVFKNSRIISLTRHGSGAAVSGGTFEIEGQQFYAFNGGPQFTFSSAISFFVNCETQPEIDELWEKLSSDGGEALQCGWLRDKFGVTWQIIPSILGKMLQDNTAGNSKKALEAMLKMKKLDINALQQAYAVK